MTAPDEDLCSWCGLSMPASIADWIVASSPSGLEIFCTVQCVTEWQESAG